MNEQDIKTNSLRAWILAARPKTLTGAAVPVMLGTALAFADAGFESFQWIPAVLCFLFAFIMQIDANFVNDYFDYLKGNDDASTRLGPKRACAEGWITPEAMRAGLVATTTIACLVGLPLVLWGGLEMILVGILCVAFCFLYTLYFSYHGLGDLLVLVFFGVIPVCLTYYLDQPSLTMRPWRVFLTSIACGIVIDTLLLINNYRDRDNDRKDGKRTLVVRLGERPSEILYLAAGFAGALIMFAWQLHALLTAPYSRFSPSCLIIAIIAPSIYLVLHYKTYKEMIKIHQGRELNRILGMTARNMFLFGLVESAAILLIF